MLQQIINSANVEDIIAELQRKKGESSSAQLQSLRTPTTSLMGTEEEAAGAEGSGATPSATSESQSALLLTSRKSKTELWNEVKIMTVTRVLAMLYALSLLTLLTRVQLNLLGRASYITSVLKLLDEDEHMIHLRDDDDDEMTRDRVNLDEHRIYLTFSWWLLNRGWKELVPVVEAAVKTVFDSISPKETVSLPTFQGLLARVRHRMEHRHRTAQEPLFTTYLLPTQPADVDFILNQAKPLNTAASSSMPMTMTPSLQRLLEETADVLDSPESHAVLVKLMDAGCRVLSSSLQRDLFPPATTDTTITTASDIKSTRLASVLAVVTREAHQMSSAERNAYVQV